MSALKKKAKPDWPLSASEWLGENTSRLAAEITRHQFSRQPGLLDKYGPKGEQKCTEDAAYHLHYLSEAIAANATSIFTDYVGWAKIMLASRGIEAGDLKPTLEAMKHVLLKQAEPKQGHVIAKHIDIALAALPDLPDSLPTFIGSDQPFAAIANKYLQSLLLLNRDDAIESVMREVERGLSMRDVFQHVIFAAQREVGRLWQVNQITVVQEHYCTAAVEILLARLRREYIGASRGVSALAMCSEGEEHCLGARLLSELLEADGWKVRYIGAKLPTRDVINHLRTQPTDVVAISIATPLSLQPTRHLIRSIKTLPNQQPRIIVGGAAFNSAAPDLWRTLGADAFGADIVDGVEAANRLVAA